MNKEVLKHISVLYVEDEADVREFTGKLLSSLVKNIHLAKNGLEGLETFKDNKEEINLIISDINMPKMGGLEMCEEIKKINPYIPVVITSAHNDPNFLKRAIEIGVSSYAMKPIDLYQLIDSMIKAFEPILLKKQLEELNVSLETRVEQEIKKIKSILDAQDNIILVVKNKEITNVNKKFLEFFGINSLNDFELNYQCITSAFEDDYGFISRQSLKEVDCWISYVQKLPEVDRLVKIKNKNNEENVYTINIDNYEDKDDYFVISLTDVTKLKEESNLLEYQANHDPLTGVFNRNKFNNIYGKELRRGHRYKNSLSIIIFDIDNFKKVNDTYGHDIGDEVIKGLATTAKKGIREHDILVRWGGEEFLIMLPETDYEGALVVAQKIKDEISINKFSSKELSITSSFGIAYLSDEDNEDSLIKRADEALYEAKRTGKDKIVLK